MHCVQNRVVIEPLDLIIDGASLAKYPLLVRRKIDGDQVEATVVAQRLVDQGLTVG